MILDMKRVVLAIEHRGIVRLTATAGTHIDCLCGWAWITEHGATDDIVLEAGQSHVISHGGITLVQGLREQALVGLRAPAVHDSGSGLAAWIERLRTQWAAMRPLLETVWTGLSVPAGVGAIPGARARRR